jgi:competence protein ComEA
MLLRRLVSLLFVLLLTADRGLGQFPSQRLPTPPTFPQKRSAEKPDFVDINSASKEQLMALPGIDESLAQKIIDSRPYKKKTELKKRKIVPESVYKQIADRITAAQSGK